jgi:hypothetical protein
LEFIISIVRLLVRKRRKLTRGTPPRSAIFISGVMEIRVAPCDHGINLGKSISASVQERGRISVADRIFILSMILPINTSKVNCRLAYRYMLRAKMMLTRVEESVKSLKTSAIQ